MRHWNYSRYKKKLVDVARVITAIGEWSPPALVGLCEVENDTVLRDLTRRSPLKELSYRYVMTHSPDLRGIDVALLYQRDLFKLLSSRSISIPPLKQYRPTRDLLHVSGLLLTGDTLDVFVCHLPSRSGGAKESESYRLYAAHILRMEVDSIMSIRSLPQVIIMGDFNDYPTNQSIQKILEAEEPPVDYQLDSLEKLEFYPKVFRNLGFIRSKLDFEFVMVTNQDGLGTPSFPEETFWPAHNLMLKTLEGEGITFDEILIDRSFPEDNAPTRKPRTGMLTKYLDNPEYDLAGSFVIGDRPTDVELAKNIGCRAIYLQDSTEALKEKGLEEV